MFKGHPKGLFVAFFANMGERFGFYTMISIFVLFMQAKYGMSPAAAGSMYATFLVGVYAFPLLGGFLADRFLGYGRTISLGLVVMFIGYVLLALPTMMNTGFALVVIALTVVALGTGLFKGNLQAVVGNLYDDPKYAPTRDRAFNIFYMGINIGAMFAPSASMAMTNWIMGRAGLLYDARIPALANDFLKGKLADASSLLSLAQGQDASVTVDTLSAFATRYINTLSRSYHLGFGVACISLIISMAVFWGFRKHYKTAALTERQKAKSEALKSQVVELTREETRERLIALGLVFFVVIFFWMAFHQSAVTLTYFARDYTVPSVGKATFFLFDMIGGLLPAFLSLLGLVFLIKKGSSGLARLLGAAAFAGFGLLAYNSYSGYAATNPFQPQMFQHFNPFFIVVLTPLVVAFFARLNAKGKEPSAPRKIGFGMLTTAAAYAILIVGSLSLLSPKALGGLVAPPESQVTVWWLISTYFMLTVAELFLSPIGISFVSKVAPPKYKGLMQGGWFAATAIGNSLVGVTAFFWERLPLSVVWAILAGACILSAGFIFAIMKRLERVAKA
jgi:proton-dependent oligopeptide transporter, POT family